jgi:predicted ATPase
LCDEPELSLHPRALSVFARAVNEAASWSRQVLIATHSPVLLSQFDLTETLATSLRDGRTEVKRLSEMPELKDLLQEYSTGSLYIAELVGAQGNPVEVSTGE